MCFLFWPCFCKLGFGGLLTLGPFNGLFSLHSLGGGDELFFYIISLFRKRVLQLMVIFGRLDCNLAF